MRKIKLLSAFVLLVLLLSPGAGRAEAQEPLGGYNVNSQVVCPRVVRGDSWLNWWDQSASAWGCTEGVLRWWNGSYWQEMASGENCASGSSGNALVHNEHSALSGNWWENGAHTASFFSGTKNSSDYCTCP